MEVFSLDEANPINYSLSSYLLTLSDTVTPNLAVDCEPVKNVAFSAAISMYQNSDQGKQIICILIS